MKRGAILLLFLAVIAISAEGKARQQQRLLQQLQQQQPPQPGPEQRRQQEILGKITDLYVSQVGKELELTDEQFLKINPLLRDYLRMRYNAATIARDVDQQIAQLSSQANPSEEETQRLIDQKAQLERRVANQNSGLLDKIRMEISLTAKQQLNFLNFQKVFFEEKLPRAIEMARQSTPLRPPPPDRPNQAKQPNKQRPDALQRGKQQ
jgi:hypothetical protein